MAPVGGLVAATGVNAQAGVPAGVAPPGVAGLLVLGVRKRGGANGGRLRAGGANGARLRADESVDAVANQDGTDHEEAAAEDLPAIDTQPAVEGRQITSRGVWGDQVQDDG